MRFKMELNTTDVKAIINNYILNRFDGKIDVNKMVVTVRSSQNYKNQEWETGEIKVNIDQEI